MIQKSQPAKDGWVKLTLFLYINMTIYIVRHYFPFAAKRSWGESVSVYTVVTILEVLCINTYTTYKCSKRRKSKFAPLLSLSLVTILVTAALLPVISLLPGIENGNGLFMLFGFVYIIPLYFLFDQPLKHLIIVMSSSWIYTMFADSFSFRAGSLYPTENVGLAVLIVQSVLFVVTLPYYIKLVEQYFCE
jgi:hypothetical protein